MTFTPVVTPPTLSLDTGTYSSEQTVAVAPAYSDGTTRYTTTGVAPVETDAILPANGQLLVDRSLTVCARTWVTGHAPSVAACRTYTLQPDAPVFTPAAGTYTTAQVITLVSPTPGTTIRYTTDGSQPTDASPVSNGSVTVETTTTVRAVAFRTGWSASAATTADYIINEGTLAPPVVSPAPGTYLHGEPIIIWGPEGATIHYTTDGTTPTLASPVYVGPLALSSSMTVSARAFRTNWTPSATTTAAFQAQVAAPGLSVPSGTYATDQTLTVTTTTPGGVIRYTTNGQDPAETDPVVPVTEQVTVDRSMILRARAWASTHVPSAVVEATYTLQPAAPAMTPPGGTYTSAQSVVLESATAGVTVRYTTDGSDPSESSPIYAAPLTIGEGTTTLKARAFKSGWTPSATTESDYAVDATPPTITAQVWPAALDTGWHNTDVTVTFVCTGAPDCPAPVVITQEGAGQVVTGTVTDDAGRQATASVTVNLDRTAGTASLTGLVDGTSTDATSLVLTGQVSDALSGIVSATCNGTAATLTNGEVTCTIDLHPGTNTVVLFARDAAGNGISSGLRVRRTGASSTIRMDPARRTLLVGESQPSTILDGFGLRVESATWTTSDPNIVTIDAAGTVTAIMEGEATITATAQGLSAEATIAVVAGVSLPPGMVRWSLTPTPGLVMEAPIYTHRVDEAVPDLYSVETDSAGTAMVRGVTASGGSLGAEVAPGTPVYGDSFGGLVGELLDAEGDARGLVRFAGPASATPWRYESAGYISAGAQAPDGTIYTTELLLDPANPGFDGDMFIVVLDGQTGTVRARVPLARSSQRTEITSYPGCQSRTDAYDYTPVVSGPIVAADGSGYFQVEQWSRTTRGSCHRAEYSSKDVRRTLTLLRVQSTGAVTSQPLFDFTFSGNPTTCEWAPRPGDTLPDGLGGVLATWDRYQTGSCALDYHLFATRFDADGSRADHLLSTNQAGGPEIVLTGDAGTAYLSDSGASLTAIDVSTWTPKWSKDWTASGENVGTVVMAIMGGGVAVHHPGMGTMTVLDEDGTVTATSAMLASDPKSVLALGEWLGIGVGDTGESGLNSDITPGSLSAVAGPAVNAAMFSFQRGEGNKYKQQSPNLPPIDVFVPLGLLTDHGANSRTTVEYKDGFGLRNRGDISIFVDLSATLEGWSRSLKSPKAVVAFIGHGIQGSFTPYVGHNVGLTFGDRSLMVKTEPQATPGPGSMYGINYWVAQKLQTHATVVFVAACWIHSELINLFDIDADTPDRALVVVETDPRPTDPPLPLGAPDIPMNRAADAFRELVRVMLQPGKSLKQAVQEVNDSDIVQFVPEPDQRRFKIRVIGAREGEDVTIRK
jgi:hypothetical protein